MSQLLRRNPVEQVLRDAGGAPAACALAGAQHGPAVSHAAKRRGIRPRAMQSCPQPTEVRRAGFEGAQRFRQIRCGVNLDRVEERRAACGVRVPPQQQVPLGKLRGKRPRRVRRQRRKIARQHRCQRTDQGLEQCLARHPVEDEPQSIRSAGRARFRQQRAAAPRPCERRDCVHRVERATSRGHEPRPQSELDATRGGLRKRGGQCRIRSAERVERVQRIRDCRREQRRDRIIERVRVDAF
jgi:hypothetical protein